MRRFQRLLLFFLAGLILVLSPAVDFHRSVFPAEVAESTPPTTQIQGVELPDLGQITFSTLPPIAESGSFSVPPEVVQALGYDPSRSWSAGQTAEDYLKLGDFQESFQLQKYNLETFATMGGASLENARLSDFELLNRQTIGDLVTAVPGLSDRKIAEVPPIADLLSQSAIGAFNPMQTLGFVAQKSDLAQLSLGGIDLTIYDLNSIPGIKFTPLETFREWQNTLLKGIPGLKDIPWSQFLNPVTLSGGIGKVDVVLGSTEKNRAYTISGSYKEGFQVPCLQESCPHIEMAGLPLLKGRQWISGKAQKVKGGHGILGLVNGGKEPTGRHPFGNAFKVVLTATKEAEAKAEFGLYFRFCAKTKFVDLGCTPYIIGPIPWIPAKEKDWIFLGFLEGIDKKAEAFKKPQTVGTPPINGNPLLPAENSVPTSVQNLHAEQLNFDPNAVNFSDHSTGVDTVEGNIGDKEDSVNLDPGNNLTDEKKKFCGNLFGEIEKLVNELRERAEELIRDEHHLQWKYGSKSNPHPIYGSVEGHKEQYEGKRTRLKNKIDDWDKNDCNSTNNRITQDVRDWAYKRAPDPVWQPPTTDDLPDFAKTLGIVVVGVFLVVVLLFFLPEEIITAIIGLAAKFGLKLLKL
ncbi:hypothetical protein ACE1CI_05195 [Aerosakkonemataceae cyanobacterium BLCC-F50]|uniref:Uncharacterized protein n=1 Tax=Floridaenema flaviceps BLCC-F50 TaxID=3153642 RepID=A0ABV4XMX2_9CYAN